MCLWVIDKKKYANNFFPSLKSLTKGLVSISQKYGYGDRDPDPHQNARIPNTVYFCQRKEY